MSTCPQCGKPGAARDRHDGHVRRFVLVFRALHRSVERQGADDAVGGRSLAAGRSIYRRHRACDPASALCALLHPRHAEDRPCRTFDEPFAGLFTQGMVVHETYRVADGDWLSPAEVRVEARRRTARFSADRRRRGSRDRPDRKNVEVEAQHGRSRRYHRDLRRRHGALVHAVRFAAGARRHLDRGRRAGRGAIRPAICGGSSASCSASPHRRAPMRRRISALGRPPSASWSKGIC